MPWTQIGAATVVVAQQFNPSVFNQLWLVRHGLLVEGDFLPGCLFTDVLVQVRSRQFHLLVVPEQLQFVPNVSLQDQQQVISDKVGTIATTLPHTPFKALGLNFDWHLTPHDGDVPRFTRQLFFREDRPLFQRFSGEDARYGGYLSKDVLGFRLKLDVKPIIAQIGDQTEHRVQFAFNYHADLGDNPSQQIAQHLARWNEVRAETEAIIDSVEPRENQ
ncbi:MAG TPA: hypothetical protein VFE62_03385 [Gemmataceae bacterium]|nr:hypothetical protein [Gemmataceae bacterium]